jgi:hypothetical protein
MAAAMWELPMADDRAATASFPTLSIPSAALIASAIIAGAESQTRVVSKKLFDADGLGKCKYL